MKLKDIEIVPGVVVNFKDPKNSGRIKVNAPTLFETDCPIPELPWIWPLFMPGYQYYSRLREGSLVWVINVPSNYHEYWYIPFFKLNFDTQEIANQGDDVDVLFDRNNGGSIARLYFTPKDGIKAENKGYFYQLPPDGVFQLKGAVDKGLTVEDGKVYVGNFPKETGTPTVRYDKLCQCIQDFCDKLNIVATDLMGASCGAALAGNHLNDATETLLAGIKEVDSKTVQLSE